MSGVRRILSRVSQGTLNSSGTQGKREAMDGAAGRLCENSLEAVTDLIARDLNGSLEPGALAYVEFDVHVSQLEPLSNAFHRHHFAMSAVH